LNVRDRITQVLIWLAVLGLSVWVGGTLYQMLVIVPMWSASPPESVRAFFQGTRYNETIWNFFGPPFMVARLAPLLGALLVGWHLRQHRKCMLVGAVCMAFGIVFTLAYVYPLMMFCSREQVEITVLRRFRQWCGSGSSQIGCASVSTSSVFLRCCVR
jgi:hypothetical protein